MSLQADTAGLYYLQCLSTWVVCLEWAPHHAQARDSPPPKKCTPGTNSGEFTANSANGHSNGNGIPGVMTPPGPG